MLVVDTRFVVDHCQCDGYDVLLWWNKIEGGDSSRKLAVSAGDRDSGPGSGDLGFVPSVSSIEFSIVNAGFIKHVMDGGVEIVVTKPYYHMLEG